jgi:hypothetical protein
VPQLRILIRARIPARDCCRFHEPLGPAFSELAFRLGRNVQVQFGEEPEHDASTARAERGRIVALVRFALSRRVTSCVSIDPMIASFACGRASSSSPCSRSMTVARRRLLLGDLAGRADRSRTVPDRSKRAVPALGVPSREAQKGRLAGVSRNGRWDTNPRHLAWETLPKV